LQTQLQVAAKPHACTKTVSVKSWTALCESCCGALSRPLSTTKSKLQLLEWSKHLHLDYSSLIQFLAFCFREGSPPDQQPFFPSAIQKITEAALAGSVADYTCFEALKHVHREIGKRMPSIDDHLRCPTLRFRVSRRGYWA
jgi:hypothetical protein